MTTTVAAEDAALRLPELLALVDQGEQVVITRDGRPVAELVPAEATPTIPSQAAVDLRSTLFVGTESMKDISTTEPMI